MKTVVMLAVGLAGALVARPAHASRSCGGGSSSSSDSSSSSHSGSSSDSSYSSSSSSSSSSWASSEAATPPCIDDTDVVGYRHCTKFGAGWSMNPRVPLIFVELGTTIRQFGGGMTTPRTGTVWHGAEQFSYRMATPAGTDGGAAAMATSLRIGVGIGHGMYAGVEGELGGLTTTPARVEMMTTGVYGAPEVETRTALVMGTAAFVGARVASGRASLSIEGAGGVRDVRYRAQSSYHDCEDTATVDVVQGVVEARARAEVWVNPWFTVGAQAGANVVARGDWMTGLYLGVHSRAFGGR